MATVPDASLKADPLALLALAPTAIDYVYEPQLHYAFIRQLQQMMDRQQTFIKGLLLPRGLKDPSSIVCSYIYASKEYYDFLLKLRQYILVGDYTRNVMVYAHMLAKAAGGPDLLGYEHLRPDVPYTDPDFKLVSCMERMIVHGLKITPSIVAELIHKLVWKEEALGTERYYELQVDLSYMRCNSTFPSEPTENGDYITCPYCLDVPIKYSYYRGGHQKTKKHVANKEAAAKFENYYRRLLKKGYEEDLIAIAAACVM